MVFQNSRTLKNLSEFAVVPSFGSWENGRTKKSCGTRKGKEEA